MVKRTQLLVVHGLDVQQIQGGQQIGILDLYAFGKRGWWLTVAISGFYVIMHAFNLLASLNLLEKTCLREFLSGGWFMVERQQDRQEK